MCIPNSVPTPNIQRLSFHRHRLASRLPAEPDERLNPGWDNKLRVQGNVLKSKATFTFAESFSKTYSTMDAFLITRPKPSMKGLILGNANLSHKLSRRTAAIKKCAEKVQIIAARSSRSANNLGTGQVRIKLAAVAAALKSEANRYRLRAQWYQ